MTGTQTASEQITAAVAAWPRVETVRGRRGEVAFRVGRRELGHLHGDQVAHLAFPTDVWLELRAESRIIEHPVFPGKPGPAVRLIEDDADVREVIELLRLNYDRIVADPAGAGEGDTEGPGRPRDVDYGPGAQ
jgi:hypothetical protein